jgi:hypothetical protein
MSQSTLIGLFFTVALVAIALLVVVSVASRRSGRRTTGTATSGVDASSLVILTGSVAGSSGADCSPGDGGGSAGCDGGGGGS